MNLGNLYAQSGKNEAAEQAYLTALKLQHNYAAAYINLADLLSSQNRQTEAEKLLRDALQKVSSAAEIHYALGLQLVRSKHLADALIELKKASQLNKNNPHFSYVYAVALKSSGQPAKAIQILNDAQKRHPDDYQTILALITFNRDMGNKNEVLKFAKRLLKIKPNDSTAEKILDDLKLTH